MKEYFQYDGLFGGLNLWGLLYHRQNILNEQMAFPPISSDPEFLDIFRNFSSPELGILLYGTLFSKIISNILSTITFSSCPIKLNPEDLLTTKLHFKKFVFWSFWITIPAFMMINSTLRLQGRVPNGHQWSSNPTPYLKSNFIE